MDNQPRTQGSSVDIGADESDGTLWPDNPHSIFFVSPNGDNANNGSSWSSAKKTVQAGIDAAFNNTGGEIWVATGTYAERVTVKANCYLYGGFSGTETVRTERNIKLNETILDGSGGGSVVTCNGFGMIACIDGFTIRNSGPNYYGIYCSSSATISNNTVSGNGSANIKYGGSGLVTHNNILGNSLEGIYCSYGKPTVTNNTVHGNDYGIHMDGCVEASLLANNTITSSKYSGIYCNLVSPTITNNTISGNDRGISLSSAYPSIANNIIAFNNTGIWTNYGRPTLSRNCLYGNTTNYSGFSGSASDIKLDPKFVDRAGGDYHVASGSPCLDAGDDASVGAGWLDTDSEPRTMGSHVDIGADEFTGLDVSVNNAKCLSNSSYVQMNNVIVSSVFDGFYYVQNLDRACGIRIDQIKGRLPQQNSVVLVKGYPTASSDGERYLSSYEEPVVNPAGSGTIYPLLLNNLSIGGGQFGLQSGVFGWDLMLQPDQTFRLEWLESNGLNNIGLLIKTYGKVTFVGDGFFYIDDGSGLNDDSSHSGVKVYGTVPVEEGEDLVGKFVTVTGISSCEKPGTDPIRIIRTRGVGDVLILN
jgi:parallel beta-helix repeat protein